MENDIEQIHFDRNINSENEVLSEGWLKEISFEGFTQTFGGEVSELVTPILKDIEKIAIKGAIGLSSKVDNFVVEASDFGYDTALVGQIEFDVDREIQANPNPTGEGDNY